MKFKFDRYFPAGYDPSTELKWALAGWGLSIGWSMCFLFRYFTELQSCLEWEKEYLNPRSGIFIPTFPQLIENCFLGFGIVIAFMIFAAILHYRWHYTGSRSIYLMRRLPDRFELARRCLTFPITAIAICLLTAAVLFFLYLALYAFYTPDRFLAYYNYDGTIRSFLTGGNPL